jgi:uncharacterized membrane protein
MSTGIRKRIASLISAIIFGLIVLWVLDRLHIVIWVNTPWWGLLLMGLALFLIIDYVVNRVIADR